MKWGLEEKTQSLCSESSVLGIWPLEFLSRFKGRKKNQQNGLNCCNKGTVVFDAGRAIDGSKALFKSPGQIVSWKKMLTIEAYIL